MGLFSKKTKKTSTVQTSPEFNNLSNFVLNSAQGVFGQGFRPYEAQRFSPFNADELQGFQQVRNFADPNSFTAQLEKSALSKFGAPPSLSDLQPYMNPFTQGVLDRANYNTTRAFDAQRAKLSQRAASGGAYGGSRFAVAEGELQDSLLDTIADTNYRGLSDAFDKGIGRYYQTGIDAMNLSQLSNKSESDRFNALINAGGAQRGLDQQGRDFAFAEFMRSINEPKSDIISAGNILAQYPNEVFGRTEVTKESPGIGNVIGGLAGMALAAVGGGAAGGAGGLLGGLLGGGAAAGGASSIFGGGGSNPLNTIPSYQGLNVGGSTVSPYAFGTTNLQPSFYNPGMKEGGLVKKNPFKRKMTGVDAEKNVTLDPSPFRSKKSKVKIEKSLQFADGGLFAENEPQNYGTPNQHFGQNASRGFDGWAKQWLTGKNKSKGKATRFEDVIFGLDPKTDAEILKGQWEAGGYPTQPETKAPDVKQAFGISESSPQRQSQPSEQSNPFEPSTLPEIKEEKTFMDRWMDNPLTQIGIALMQGSGPDVLGGFGNALSGNYEAREMREDAQREEQQKRQMEIDQENTRRREAAEMLAFRKNELDQQMAAEYAKINDMREKTKLMKADKYTQDIVRAYAVDTDEINGLYKILTDPSSASMSDKQRLEIQDKIDAIEERRTGLMSVFNATIGLDETDPYMIKPKKSN